MKLATVAVMVLSVAGVHAQNTEVGQNVLTPYGPCGPVSLVVLCGGGTAFHCGIAVPVLPFTMTEMGVLGPQKSRGTVTYLSEDAMVAVSSRNKLIQRHHETPFVVGGYTRLRNTAHEADLGAGFARNAPGHHVWQVEAKDSISFSDGPQHNVFLRVGMQLGSKR